MRGLKVVVKVNFQSANCWQHCPLMMVMVMISIRNAKVDNCGQCQFDDDDDSDDDGDYDGDDDDHHHKKYESWQLWSRSISPPALPVSHACYVLYFITINAGIYRQYAKSVPDIILEQCYKKIRRDLIEICIQMIYQAFYIKFTNTKYLFFRYVKQF